MSYSRSSVRSRLATNPSLVVWTIVVAAAVWSLPEIGSGSRWAGFGVILVATLLMMEWNNRSSLIHVRSRLTSSAFLFLFTLFPQWHDFAAPLWAAMAGLISYILLFTTYQSYRPEGYTFHAFLLLGLASLTYTPLLFLALPLWVYMIVFLRSFSFRTFFASLFGILLPYIYGVGYVIWKGTFDEVFESWTATLLPASPDYAAVELWHIVAYGFTVLLAVPAVVHSLRSLGREKRRTVAYFGIIISQTLLLLLCLPLQPQAFSLLFPLMLITLSPLLAHQFTLAKGRATDLWFYVALGLGVAIGLCNYLDVWTPLSTFL